MTFIEVIALSIIQGLTEFIPVSSSGHLEILSELIGLDVDGSEKTALFVILHVGTLLSLITYYIYRFNQKRETLDKFAKNIDKIVIGAAPIFFFALMMQVFLNEDEFYSDGRGFLIAAVALIITGSFFMFSTNIYRGKNNKEIKDLSFVDTIIIGLIHSFGLIFGASRSGSSITGGRLRGLNNQDSLDFSFFIGIPAISAAGIYEIASNIEFVTASENIGLLLLGFIISFIVGLIAIEILFRYLKNNNLNIFGAYCIAVGIISLVIHQF